MNEKRWSATQIFAFGFALLILTGGLLLCLPVASRDGVGIPFLNALFTSTSATCVTGLIRYDTWTQFSYFGQAVILLLIQVGGLGFMAVAILFSLAIGRRIGLRERSLLAEAISFMQVGGVVRLIRRALIGTAIIEGTGAILLAIRFVPMFGLGRGIWFGVFHSVSAFCNAGFDLMGIRTPFSSLTSLYNDPLVILTIAGLIIVGGIGFMVWNDLVETRCCFKKMQLHTRAVLLSTLTILLAGTVAFAFLESRGEIGSMHLGNRILSSFFQSVTPRTAGFNSVDIASLSDSSKLVTMLLMMIGAAPGGTGGGIKVTTLVVMLAAVLAQLKARSDVSLGRSRLDGDTLRRAFCTVAIYLTTTVIGILILSAQGQPLTDSAFECLSAIGTVGLTTGITQSLSPLSSVVIILLMYTARVGGLTVFMAVAHSDNNGKLTNPIGKIIVG